MIEWCDTPKPLPYAATKIADFFPDGGVARQAGAMKAI